MGQDELPQGVTSAVHRGSTATLGLPTLVLGAEAALTVVAIRGEVQPKPVLAADDRGWEAGSSEPVGTGRGQGQETSQREIMSSTTNYKSPRVS